ncbi:MAG TPA: efflux RND transporter periplasmic adaptor subunit [Myxococcota bacterium]|nr:efflux RND transporter periplasmic adaptor subunit [Myxococcota bacterium]
MTRARWPAAIALLAVLVLLAGFSLFGRSRATFTTVPVAKTDLVRAITATGSVNPVVTVQVGTYVSGPVQTLHCDFNTEVEPGQLCATIDPRPYQETVDQAKAELATAQAQLDKDQASLAYAKINYDRDRGLRDTGVVSQDTLDSDRSSFDQATSQVKLDRAAIAQRKAALEAAQINLNYTNIVSPVKGTVVSRNVDVGQTVAASFQTPTLFLIARDLTKMQVDTNVSESDVGLAQVGQKASFTVESYPGRTFAGKVVQVRRAPITVQNVVTYDVVVGVDNPDKLLFPGMTANVRIIVEEHNGVTAVPSRALRFDPGPDYARQSGAVADAKQRHVWLLRDGHPLQIAVSTGLDDGTNVEITSDALAPGALVIVGMGDRRGRGSAASSSQSPFRF